MKRILITGANSYIGTSFENYIKKYSGKYSVNTLDMRGEDWKKHDFSKYDVVFHVAGIAHVKTTSKNKDLYYKVNTELAIETARKAKMQGVKQFIFMSSMYSMYMHTTNKKDNKKHDIIFGHLPKTVYGESKLLAERGILPLIADDFNAAIVKPPMIYGKDCKGNYPRLSKLTKILPIFPDYQNKRSMLYIDNLCEFIRLIIDNGDSGEFYPQNQEYVCTSELVKEINPQIKLTKLFNPVIRLMCGKINVLNKLFGDLYYDKSISRYKQHYDIKNFEQSIKLTESLN